LTNSGDGGDAMKPFERICYCLFHDLKTEERSREVLQVLSGIGETITVSSTEGDSYAGIKNISPKGGRRSYIAFLVLSLRTLAREKPFDMVCLHDNYSSILIPFVKWFVRPRIIVYDASEYYPVKECLSGIRGNPFIFFKDLLLRVSEKTMIGLVDLVIAANGERAEAMYSYYHLPRMPIIFDNVHKILDSYDVVECRKKYGCYFEREDIFTIVYAGGIDKVRDTYRLADAVMSLGGEFQLLVLGSATPEEIQRFKKFVECEEGPRNVHYLGFTSRAELKFLYERCHAGVVAFTKTSFNNIFCASGKMYECLFCGKPIVCSDNPPLMSVCREYGVGIASDDYSDSIVRLKSKYEDFLNNAVKFSIKYDYQGRHAALKESIMKAIEM
jgi:glycosyltransferase involved in cell wall biosynthesis